jgi:hypothetical protein
VDAAAKPDIFSSVLTSTLRDAWPLMRSRIELYIVLAMLSTAAFLAGNYFAYLGGPEGAPGIRLNALVQPLDISVIVATFFIFPAAARTVRPEFRMTAGRVLGVFGVGIVVDVVATIGLFLLIWPGVWILVKWSQATWAYLLSDGENPFNESWQLTNGWFWQTFGFFMILWVLLSAVISVTAYLPLALAFFVPVLGLVAIPVAVGGMVLALHISLLGWMRWLLALRG